jgi:hypothetical protein
MRHLAGRAIRFQVHNCAGAHLQLMDARGSMSTLLLPLRMLDMGSLHGCATNDPPLVREN